VDDVAAGGGGGELVKKLLKIPVLNYIFLLHCWIIYCTLNKTLLCFEMCDIIFQYHKVTCFGTAVPSSDLCSTQLLSRSVRIVV
jgi:hypothetical protein